MAIYQLNTTGITNGYVNNEYNIYNTDEPQFLANIKNKIIKLYNMDYDKYYTNLSKQTSDINTLNYDIYNNYYLVPIVHNYYEKTNLYTTSIDTNRMNMFLNTLLASNQSQIVYNTSGNYNIDDQILFRIFIETDKQLYGDSFSNFYYLPTNINSTSTQIFIDSTKKNYWKFIFTQASPFYRIYYLYTFLTQMSIDTKLINTMPKDLVTLRDFLLLFVDYLITRNFITSPFKTNTNYQFPNFDFTKINIYNLQLGKNFICYDNINIFSNSDFLNILQNNNNLNQLFVYSGFYFIKNNILVAENIVSIYNIYSILVNLSNNIRYNYDDNVFNILLETISQNKEFFIDINTIINLLNQFFNKYDFSFLQLVDYKSGN
jgi:hypothetical protein